MKDKVCLVTGASSGIGVAVALAFAEKGCAGIALVARRKERLEDVANRCKSAGAKDVLVLAKDLSDLEACAEAVKETVEHFGRLDVLVNNAGVYKSAPVAEMSNETFLYVMNLNLTAPMVLSREAIPHLRKTKGNMIHISSVGGVMAGRGLGAYGTAKAGLIQLSRVISVEEAPFGVRSNIISPGAIATDMLKGLVEDLGGGAKMTYDQLTDLMANTFQPLKQTGMPRDIGLAAAYLADGDTGGFITGTNLVVDGGLLSGLGNQVLDDAGAKAAQK